MKELEELLKSHDWYFEYSDDHKVWRRGKNQLNAIRRKVKDVGSKGLEMYNKYKPKL
jgi:hypothetical protein